MKKVIMLCISTVLLSMTVVSCKKDSETQGVAGLTIINALPDCPAVLANFSGQHPIRWYATALSLKYGTFDPSYHITVPAKEQQLMFYKFPDTMAKDLPVSRFTFNPVAGDISTLFLIGTQTQRETLLVKNNIPVYSSKDSLMALRFANLIPGSGPMKVTVSGKGIDVLSNNLAYKGITAYLPITATSAVSDVLVKFFDQVSGTLLANYTLKNVGAKSGSNPWRYRSFTLALKNGPDSSNPGAAQTVLKINDY